MPYCTVSGKQNYTVLALVVMALQTLANITLVRAGEQPQPQPRSAAGLLTTALGWELLVGLARQLKFQGPCVDSFVEAIKLLEAGDLNRAHSSLERPYVG